MPLSIIHNTRSARLPVHIAPDHARQRSLDIEHEVLARLRQSLAGSHKAATWATRQHFEHQLTGASGMRIAALSWALGLVPESLRGWCIAPLLVGEPQRSNKHVLLETSEAVSAAADLNEKVVKFVADGKVTAAERRQIRAAAARLVREAGEVEVSE